MKKKFNKQNKCSLGGGYFTHYNNVKGFTLIELLAVIVILAIIALIATPIILGIINDSKEKSFRISLKNVEHAYEIYATQHNIEPETIVDIKNLPLDSKNLTGKVMMNEEGKVEIKQVTDGTYSATGTLDDLNIIKGSIEELLKDILTIKININQVTLNSITVSVETIDGLPTSYSYKITGPDNYEQKAENETNASYTFTGLKQDTTYTITVTAKNDSGKTTNPKTKTGKTSKIGEITLNLTPKGTFIQSGNVLITYPSIIEGQVNQYAWCTEEEMENDECESKFTIAEENPISIPAQNKTLMARVLETSTSEEALVTASRTINNIDSEGPTVEIEKNGLTVTIIANDTYSGLHSEKPYSCDGGTTWKASNECEFEEEGTYEIKVRDKALNETTQNVTVQLFDENNGAQPVLNNLTPVKYENNNWVMVSNTDESWYNYSNQEWANAVLLRSNVSKSVGDTVSVTGSNPEAVAMFVWIPRYEYKIEGQYGTHPDGTAGTANLPGEIEVNFISKDTVYEGTNNEGYRIHPAFTFGTQDLDGIWVGKFETTGTASNPTILPSVSSLRNQNVSTQFATAQKFVITGYDSHMAKNSEWGAAAYLSQSKYGKYGNSSYDGAGKEVRINNCNSGTSSDLITITGIGANSQDEAESKTTCTTNTYETNNGMAASTTGNITGIYDMSGGAAEYVMGVYKKTKGDSGLTVTSIDAKYYDNYTTTTFETACSSGICYGHALSETRGWYGDSTTFVESSYPWLRRGNDYPSTTRAGVFADSRLSGNANNNGSFRVILSQTT